MEKVIYFTIILCGILSQGICQVSEENNEKSSHLQIRRKRVVGGSPRRPQTSPFLINVLEDGNDHCPASLLTADVAITSAACFINHNTRNMTIMSRTTTEGKKLHEISRVNLLDPHYNPARPTRKNLALLRFFPPIHYDTSYHRPIPIYSGFLAGEEELSSRVISWDRPYVVGNRKTPANSLRSFSAVVISVEYCHRIYPNIIGEGNLCAVGNPGEYCETSKDSGVPLVKNFALLGIFVFRGPSRTSNPDVFMNLLDHSIRRWIHQHVPSLGLF